MDQDNKYIRIILRIDFILSFITSDIKSNDIVSA